MMRLVAAATLLSGCLSGFDPHAQTYGCVVDSDCAPGYRCVDTGGARMCARPLTEDADAADTASADADDGAAQSLVVATGVVYAASGDHLVQVGGANKHFFVARDAMTLSEATVYCAMRSASGLSWRVARMAELRAMSRCCLTRPGQDGSSCSETGVCFHPSNCAITPACTACGAPPAGDTCWWDKTFTATCGTFWLETPSACPNNAFGFDFERSEIVALDPETEQRVICSASES